MRTAGRSWMKIITFVLICFLSLNGAMAANAPSVLLTTLNDRSKPWRFPTETMQFFVKVTGNPDYLVNDPDNHGGGYVELYANGNEVSRTRIFYDNTPDYFYVQVLACPAYLCGVDVYHPYAFGSPTNVTFNYTFPATTQGNYIFTARFSGDDFTSAAVSTQTTIQVSCAVRPSGGPPAGSGCP